jgi:hypothetical protein
LKREDVLISLCSELDRVWDIYISFQVCVAGLLLSDTYFEFFHRVVFGQNATFRKPDVLLSAGKIKFIEHALLGPSH